MGAIGHDGLALPGRVDLAHEPPFTVGRLSVHPAMRQVIGGDERLMLEPKVMKVLVALARADGAVVTRDELIEWCWQGRTVGNDAVDRVIARVRSLSRGLGSDTFRIETIRRIGYVLTTAGAQPLAESGPVGTSYAKRPRPISRRTLAAGTILSLLAAGSGGWFIFANPPRSPAALRYYKQGLELRGQGSLAQTEQSVAYFREAVRLDAEFADAWGALAWAYCALLEYGFHPDTDNVRLMARSAAVRALELDPVNVSAQGALLTMDSNFRNWERIERGCKALLSTDPNNTLVKLNLAFNFCEVGRWHSADSLLTNIVAQEPLWPLGHQLLVSVLFVSGRHYDADEAIEKALRLWPQHPGLWFVRARQLILTKRYQQALILLDDTSRHPADLDPIELALEKSLATALADGSDARRQSTASEFLDAAKRNTNVAPTAAFATGLLGYLEPAFDILEGYYFGQGRWAEARSPRPRTLFLFNETARPLRKHIRFDRLVEALGLEQYWKATGSRPDYR